MHDESVHSSFWLKLLFSLREVQAATGISRSKLYLLMRCGVLSGVKVGRRTYIRQQDLASFLASLRPQNPEADR